jgi:hypothetical protein
VSSSRRAPLNGDETVEHLLKAVELILLDILTGLELISEDCRARRRLSDRPALSDRLCRSAFAELHQRFCRLQIPNIHSLLHFNARMLKASSGKDHRPPMTESAALPPANARMGAMGNGPIDKLTIDYRLATVGTLIADGAELVALQEALVANLKEKGRDTVRAEDTLGILRCTQIIFQNYRRDLIEKSKSPGAESQTNEISNKIQQRTAKAII